MKEVALGLLLATLSGGVFAQGPEATGTTKEVAGGSAQGAAAPATTMIGPVPAWAVGLGIGAVAIGVMVAAENDQKTTTNH